MAKVILTKHFQKQVERIFKEESVEVFQLAKSLESSPRKGKLLATIAGVQLKELKYNSFRFYFICDGIRYKIATQEELEALLIKFIALSKKNNQQAMIMRLKTVLKSFGFEKF